MIIGSMTEKQIVTIENTFAFLTKAGWKFPQWVHDLRKVQKP